jgi:hypothetical protein
MEPVNQSFVTWAEELITLHEDKLLDWMIVTDKTIIEDIYNLTEIPDETNAGVTANNRIGKKNSQVIAPFLLILIPDEENPESNFIAGWLQSQIGLTAIENGYHTGFCICVNHKKLSPVLKENNLWNPAVIEVLEQRIRPPIGCTTVLFSIGTADPECKYNYSKIERREIRSIGKMVPMPNITIVD